MRNGRGSTGRPGKVGRWVCRIERRMLGLGMRAVAVVADRQMKRYHAREAAAADAAPETKP